MNKTIKKSIKIILISLISFLLIISLVVTILLSYVVTPEKITPIINDVANNYLKTELKIESVDISFMEHFPFMGVTLKNGFLKSTESLDQKTSDTVNNNELIQFEKIIVRLNPWDAIFNGKINIAKIELQKPNIYASIDKLGNPNWNIYNSSPDTVAIHDIDTTETAFNISSIELGHFQITNAKLIYNDISTNLYAEIDDYNFSLKGEIGDKDAKLKVETNAINSLLWQNGELLFKQFDFGLNTYIRGNSDDMLLHLENGKLSLNNIVLDANGVMGRDSVNILASINTGNINDIISVIPNSIVEHNNKFNSSGSIILNSKIVGNFSSGLLPIVDGTLVIKDVTAKYDGFKRGIDNLSANIKYHINVNKKNDSKVAINKFMLKSSKSYIDINAVLTNVFKDQILDLKGKVNVDLGEISEIMPFNKDLTFDGVFDFNGDIVLDATQIKKMDIAKISADANLQLDSVKIIVPQRGIHLDIYKINAKLSKSSAGFLMVTAGVRNSKFKMENKIDAFIKNSQATFTGVNSNDFKGNYIKSTFQCDSIDISLDNGVNKLKSSSLEASVRYSKLNKKIYLKSDSLYVKYFDNSALLSNAIINLNERDAKLFGVIDFSGLIGNVKGFSKPLELKATKLIVENSNVNLTDASFLIGDSDVKLTGTVENLFGALKGNGAIKINSHLKSKFVNVDELMNLSDFSSDLTTEELPNKISADISNRDVPGAEKPSTVFLIPNNVIVDFDLNIDKAIFGNVSFTHISGNMKVDSSRLLLSGVGLDALDAQLRSALEYRVISENNAIARVVLIANAINVDSVLVLVPVIDSLFPMINSLSGVVSMRVSSVVKLDSTMQTNLKTLLATVNISGENVEIKDSEEFDKLAKMLMFKKRVSNKIDSLAIESVISNGSAEVLPFLLNINRYSLGVGGEYFLDNSFNYHVSILKSPIPFRMGINIVGNIDNFDFKFGKARYKRNNAPTEIGTSNPLYKKQWSENTTGLKW